MVSFHQVFVLLHWDKIHTMGGLKASDTLITMTCIRISFDKSSLCL